MPNEDPAPCFITLGVVMIVFDLIIINTTYLMFFGGIFIFLGIVFTVKTTKKTQKTMNTGIAQSQKEQ